jgi:hypothetical protein
LTWTAPSGSAGAQVTIANGETKILETNGDPTKWIEVTRDSAAALTGTETDVLTNKINNLLGMDDVTSAEQSSGDAEYRCIGIENLNSAQVQDIKVTVATLGTQQTSDVADLPPSGAGTIETAGTFADWPSSGHVVIKDSGGTEREIVYYTSRTDTVLTVPAAGRGRLDTSAAAGAATDTVDAIPGLAILLDAPASQPSGAFEDETGAGEGSAPTGTFETPITDAAALDAGDLDNGEIYGIWIWRDIPAGATARTGVVQHIRLKFDAA